MDVRVGERGEDAAAAEVDDLRARERGLVDADTAGDICTGDRSAREVGSCGSSVRMTPFSRITAASLAMVAPVSDAPRAALANLIDHAHRRFRRRACRRPTRSK